MITDSLTFGALTIRCAKEHNVPMVASATQSSPVVGQSYAEVFNVEQIPLEQVEVEDIHHEPPQQGAECKPEDGETKVELEAPGAPAGGDPRTLRRPGRTLRWRVHLFPRSLHSGFGE